MLRDTLKTLLSAYGPSGNEHAVAEAVKTLIAAHVDSMRVDALVTNPAFDSIVALTQIICDICTGTAFVEGAIYIFFIVLYAFI